MLLASYTANDFSRRYTGMTDDNIIEEALENLAEIYSKELSFVQKEFKRGVIKRWGSDPHFLGAWAHESPNQVS